MAPPLDTGPSVTDIIGAAVAVIALIVGWFQLRLAVRDRRARDRPYVTLTGDVSAGRLRFVVQNHGATRAEDVSVLFPGPLKNSQDNTLLSTGEWRIGSMAPGQRVLLGWDLHRARVDTKKPMATSARLTYGWPVNRTFGLPQVSSLVEDVEVDFSPLLIGFVRQGAEDDALAALKDLSEAVQKIAKK